MSTYTTTDRDNVKDALLDLALNKRVVSTEVGGRTREFNQTSIPALRKLLIEIEADLDGASEIAGARRYYTTITSDTW